MCQLNTKAFMYMYPGRGWEQEPPCGLNSSADLALDMCTEEAARNGERTQVKAEVGGFCVGVSGYILYPKLNIEEVVQEMSSRFQARKTCSPNGVDCLKFSGWCCCHTRKQGRTVSQSEREEQAMDICAHHGPLLRDRQGSHFSHLSLVLRLNPAWPTETDPSLEQGAEKHERHSSHNWENRAVASVGYTR